MKNRKSKRDWEKLLADYGEKYSVTYAPMYGTLPHPSEGAFTEDEE
jgi:hypothetical protein